MRERGGGWVAAQGLIALVYLLAPRIGPRWPVPLRVLALLLAVPLLAVGAVFAGYGGVALGRDLTMFPKPPDDTTLRTEGIYGCVRHPIYGGLLMTAIAGALFTGSIARLVVAGGLFGFFNAKAAAEERWLTDRFPEYRAYAAKVRRMLPGLW